MLRTGLYKNIQHKNSDSYSNFHYSVDLNGYYHHHTTYDNILSNHITGLIRVCCVHCTYLIPNQYLSFINYDDNSNRYEYVIFSETLRKNNISQYIDNTHKYGYLTFVEVEEEFNLEYNYYKNKFDFVHNINSDDNCIKI